MLGMDFMKKLKEAQEAIGQMDEKLAALHIEFRAGGGMVTVVMNGKKELLDIRLDPTVVNPDDVEMLQDLIIAAFRGAFDKVEEETKASLSEMMGGIDISNIESLMSD